MNLSSKNKSNQTRLYLRSCCHCLWVKKYDISPATERLKHWNVKCECHDLNRANEHLLLSVFNGKLSVLQSLLGWNTKLRDLTLWITAESGSVLRRTGFTGQSSRAAEGPTPIRQVQRDPQSSHTPQPGASPGLTARNLTFTQCVRVR